MSTLGEAMAMAWSGKRVWLLQFLLNPVLFALGALWLTIPEAHVWQLVLSAVLAVVVVIAALGLQSGTLVYFGEPEKSWAAFRAGWRTLIAFAVWAALLAGCLCLVSGWSEHAYQFASYMRSILPSGLRRHIGETQMDSMVLGLAWFVCWIAAPGIFLPMGRQMAKHGFGGLGKHGWRAWWRTVRSGWYWLSFVVLAALGIYVPQRLIAWVPKMSSMSGETTSMVLRLLVAWLLAVTAWVVLASVVGRLGGQQPDEQQ